MSLGEDGEGLEWMQRDEAYVKHIDGSKLSMKIFEEATIEKHIKSVDSFKLAAKMKKIWEEIDKVSMKRNKTAIEKVLSAN